VQVQLWAPQLDAARLDEGLRAAHIPLFILPSLDAVAPHQPLLVVYAEPLAQLHCRESGAQEILSQLPRLVQGGEMCRLVNLSCAVLPALVAWCVTPSGPVVVESPPIFPQPEPIDALLAQQILAAQPERLEAYQELESHPLAAALDQRPPDLQCLQRYRRATGLDALLRAQQARLALEEDLRELAAQIEPLRQQQLEALAVQQQLALLQARLEQADVLERRCSDLQLSVQAQQQELEQISRRQALLEQLVSDGSDAGRRLQIRLAQTLA
jgi:hypothetical protein